MSEYTDAVDVWSFGCVLYELHTRLVPYEGMQCGMMMRDVSRNKLRPETPADLPQELIALYESCLAFKAKERPQLPRRPRAPTSRARPIPPTRRQRALP